MKRGEFIVYILNKLTHIGAIQTWLTLDLDNTKTTSSSQCQYFCDHSNISSQGCFQSIKNPNKNTLTIVREQHSKTTATTLFLGLNTKPYSLQPKTSLKIK